MAWRAGQDPGQRRIAQYFLPDLGLPLSLSLGCENVLSAVSRVCQPDAAPGPTLALTLTYIRPVLHLRSHARHTHTHARPSLPQLLQTDWRLTEVA